mmetsp:Transcript_22683/g.33495  ORF Transcript_22683/g.33495 Transcript_22683/m.33495 type:complete len:283 (+) Transcript_22683:17-865(+)
MASSSAASALFSISGKNVLVTGGSRGIGLMIAKGFVQAGANVIVTSRDEKACAEAASQIQCRYVTSTLSTRQGCESLAQSVKEMFENRLDVLINNAGTSWGEEPWDNFDPDTDPTKASKRANWGFDKVLDLNVKSIFYLTHACVPLLQKHASDDDPSRVINVGSIAGLIPQSTPTHAYDVSKAAVHHLTKKLAADFAPQRITVNAIAPGYVPSRMSKGLNTWIEPGSGDLTKNIPLGRMGTEDDMAGACIYLSSLAGSWCTGVILNVDGGQAGANQLQISNL